MREIEYGTKREYLETLSDSDEIQRIYFEMLNATTKKLLLLFPTTNAFHRLERNELT